MKVEISGIINDVINFAAFQSECPLIRNIHLTGEPGQRVSIKIWSDPKFIFEFRKDCELRDGTADIDEPPLVMNSEYMRTRAVEAIEGCLYIDVFDSEDLDKKLGDAECTVHIHPYNHWDAGHFPQTLPAFMQPSDSLVSEVVKAAMIYAENDGIVMNAYQEQDPDMVVEQVKCIYRALSDKHIHYISSPASFEQSGQKIRFPRVVLQGEGPYTATCIDMAVLFCSCLEACRINSAVILIPKHAFAAFWTENVYASEVISSKLDEVLNAIEEDNAMLVPVECTQLTAETQGDFESAVSIARDNLEKLEAFIDVSAARHAGITPVFTDTNNPSDGAASVMSSSTEQCAADEKEEEEKAPEKQLVEGNSVASEEDRPDKPAGEEPNEFDFSDLKLSRLDVLKRESMDISMRNRLLCLREDKNCLRFSASSDLFFDKDVNSEQINSLIRQSVDSSEYDKFLRRLLKADRESRRDLGIGTIYLTVDELHWIPRDEGSENVSPLFTRQVTIKLKKNGEYAVYFEPEIPRFNPVVREMLSQDFKIDIYDIDSDGSGSRSRQLEILRKRISGRKGWKIVENKASIGIFSLPNEMTLRLLGSETVKNHDIVKGILKGIMTWNNERGLESENEVPVYYYQADESQREVIQQSLRKRASIVMGPAGNGKSLTNGNVILNEVMNGRKVLFVAEKLAAMSVVADEMDRLGMNDLYLLLNNSNSNQKSVTKQIADKLEHITRIRKALKLKEMKIKDFVNTEAKLTDFMNLHLQKDEDGNSIASLVDEWEKYRGIPVHLDMSEAGEIINDPDIELLMDDYIDAVSLDPEIRGSFDRYLKKTDMTGTERDMAVRRIDKTLALYRELELTLVRLAKELGIEISEHPNRNMIKELSRGAKAIHKCPFIASDITEVERKLATAGQSDKNDILQVLDSIEGAPAFSARYRGAMIRVMRMLDNHDTWDITRNRTALRHATPESIKTAIEEGSIRPVMPYELMKLQGKLSTFNELKNSIQVHDEGLRRKILDGLKKTAEGHGEKLKDIADRVAELAKPYSENVVSLTADLLKNLDEFEKNYPDMVRTELLVEWKNAGKPKAGQVRHLEALETINEYGLGGVANQIETYMKEGLLDKNSAKRAFRCSRCEYNIQKKFEEGKNSGQYSHYRYNLEIKKYIRQEEALRADLNHNLLAKHLLSLPNIEEGVADSRELGFLTHLSYHGSGIKSIRDIFMKAPHALSELFPVMIMSPEDAVRYIPEEYPHFDMVIIDEGSQMPTYKALYPIAKGKSCMIFGDDRQLTPTKYFRRKVDDVDEEYDAMTAILEDAVATAMPRKMLRYHYRSQNEGLIAFSNKMFYNGSINTFPANSTVPGKVECFPVAGGIYERGGRKVNLLEADTVVDKVIGLCAEMDEKHPKTIGVITMNSPQRDLIQAKLIERGSTDEHLTLLTDEYISIVNLENCQGKEWDIVVLSTVFGLDADGDMTANFGVINHVGGENRINVMVTRARERMILITSLKPEMLNFSEAPGVICLKNFISYAMGDLKIDTRSTGVANDGRGIARTITERLNRLGYVVHTNIGTSSNKVDIGIVSKKNSDRYVLGILLDRLDDGPCNVRDFEIIKPEILKKNGWKLYRLHSVNWYMDAENEINNIINLINE